MSEIPSKYDPASTEDKWYAYWMEHKLFKSVPDEREPFTIVIPPPNVTGVLHMGHMLNNTIQDLLVRRARMQGKNALWVPGTDHASIATEAKVVQKLRKEGIKKSDLSRDAFLEHAWEWTHKHGGIILEQLKKLGASCDWDRTRFTMDEKYYDSVIDTFIDLYKKGKIYRGERMINWDPAALTALSDEEVIYKEVSSKLYHVRYKIVGTEEYLVIATTRPETILGDTAVCVNPKDERYKHLHGKRVMVPLVNREVPIIADEYVEMEFGTGCLKVTPAHDMNDFMLGEKHNLEVINMMNDNGTISEAGQLYIGMDRFDVRKQIAEDLQAAGLMEKVEDYMNKVGFSERSDAVVEPRLSLQWWVSMKELSQPALENVMNDNIRFFPPKFKNSYRNWMENVKDWCISRQLWWGHRIPAWFAPDGRFAVAKTAEEAVEILNNENASASAQDSRLTTQDLTQDPDVLDTWFSSWLWPISVFDGFYSKEEVDYYYPTNDLVTAPEIMFFWVARMIIAGYEYRGELPFRNVYYTGIVRDKQGRKMSKSLGNSPDPIDLMKVYGADGVRVGMLLSSPAGNDLLFDEGLCEQGRNFANKIWNAFRLVNSWGDKVDNNLAQPAAAKVAVEWMQSRFNTVLAQLNDDYDKFRINEALMNTYKLVWDDFCSWYLEMAKPAYGESMDAKTYQASVEIFENILKVLHPFMPFLTEEVWHYIGKRESGKGSICVASWPSVGLSDIDVLDKMNFTQESVTIIRELRTKAQLLNKDATQLEIVSHIGQATNNHPDPFYFIAATQMNKQFKFEIDSVSLSGDRLQVQGCRLINKFDLSSGFYINIEPYPITRVPDNDNKVLHLSGWGRYAGHRMTLKTTEYHSVLNDNYFEIRMMGMVENANVSGYNGAFDLEMSTFNLNQQTISIYDVIIKKLCNVSEITEVRSQNTLSSSFINLEFFIPYSSNIDIEAEKKKINDELEYTRGFLKSVEAKLNNEKFTSKAPAAVLEGERKKQSDALSKIQLLEEKLASLG